MTEFTKAEFELYATKDKYDSLVDLIGSPEEQSTPTIVLYLEVESRIVNLGGLAAKFRRRLFESRMKTEEERTVHYGPQMQERVRDFLKKVETLEDVWEKRIAKIFERSLLRYKENRARQERELKLKLKQEAESAVCN